MLKSTWLKDANLAATETFGVNGIAPDGSMTWATATQWIAAMNAANYKGFSDWRLPRIAPIGEDFVYYSSFDGSTDYGYNNTSPQSELAYMFYVGLVNKGINDTAGNPQTGYGLVDDPQNPNDESLFRNIYCTPSSQWCPTYWSGTRYGQNPYFPTNDDAVWVFGMDIGAQSGDYEWKFYRAWPVRDGDVLIQVQIDIKPGSDPNNINLGSSGLITVSILTTPGFDARSVDAATVTLGNNDGKDTGVALNKKGQLIKSLKDVDRDGDLDLVLSFEIRDLVLNRDLDALSTALILNGRTLNDHPIQGTDSIRIVQK